MGSDTTPAQYYKSINPSNGTKFSPNLRKWLMKHHKNALPKVYREKKDGAIWFGYIDKQFGLMGTHGFGVLCDGGKDGSGNRDWLNEKTLVELPNFWRDYAKRGRCVFDPEHDHHFIGDGDRWIVSGRGQYRSCRWCGECHQQLFKWTEKVKREKWTSK